MPEENVDLLWKGLFFPDPNEDGQLNRSLYTDVNRAADDGLSDPVASFFEKTQLDRAMGKASAGDWNWDQPISTTPALEKRDSDDADDLRKLRKNIARVEKVRDENGELWANAYDKDGALVDARILVGADAA